MNELEKAIETIKRISDIDTNWWQAYRTKPEGSGE